MKKILLLALLAGIIFGAYYFIFSKDDWESGTPLSSVSVSEEKRYAENLSEKDIQKIVFYTLPEHALIPGNKGKVFCSNRMFGYDEDYKENVINVYIFAYCEEYYLKGDKITPGSGISSPLKMIFKIGKESLIYNSLLLPGNESENKNSIPEVFPEKYVNDAIKGVDLSELIPSPKTQAENYYKGKLEVYF